MMDKSIVKVELTTIEETIKPALAEVSVTDAKGRIIKLKKPAILAQFRIVEALGDAAKNPVYVGMVLPVIYVAAIDDEPVDFPLTKLEVEAIIQRLDDDGFDAVAKGIEANFGAKDSEAEKALVKK